MKTISILPFLLFTFSTQLVLAQAPDTLWMRTYGEGRGNCVLETTDHGYVVVGDKAGDVYLLKTDSMGDTLWTKTYGGSEDDIGVCIQQTQDDGYIIVGRTTSYGAGNIDFWLLETDDYGDTLWTKTYGGWGNDIAVSGLQTLRGGYLINGVFHLSGGDLVCWIIKTDFEGDTLWTKTYGITESLPTKLIKTLDNAYVFGSCWLDEARLFKINSMGDTIWTKTYRTPEGISNVYIKCVQQTMDEGYIWAGTCGNPFDPPYYLWIVKTDSMGDTLWTKQMHAALMPCDIQQTTDSCYIMGGTRFWWRMGSYCIGGFLMKTYDFKNLLWMMSQSPADTIFGKHHSIQITSDNGYIITGAYPKDYIDNILLIKFAPESMGIDRKTEDYVSKKYHIFQNYPNPFNPTTTIELDLPKSSTVSLKVFNILGEEVATLVSDRLSAGSYSYEWDASNLASGVYLYKLQAGDYVETRKMVLMR